MTLLILSFDGSYDSHIVKLVPNDTRLQIGDTVYSLCFGEDDAYVVTSVYFEYKGETNSLVQCVICDCSSLYESRDEILAKLKKKGWMEHSEWLHSPQNR
jgi:hypothetical protein